MYVYDINYQSYYLQWIQFKLRLHKMYQDNYDIPN